MQTVIGLLVFAAAAPPAPEDAVVRRLVDALKDAAPEKRSGAAYTLALIGPPARSAMPALLDALADKDTDVRRQVSYAIGRILLPGRPSPEVTAPQPRGGLR